MSRHQHIVFGARGELPAFVPARVNAQLYGQIARIPGVSPVPGGFKTTWDAAPVVARICGARPPLPPANPNPALGDPQLREELLRMPGLRRYRELGFHEKLRGYQKLGAAFLARRAYALNCDPMRSGKSLQSLAAAELVGARKTLIVCPALVNFPWADEVLRWTGEEAVILQGRAGDYARQYCAVCEGRGHTKTESHCASCRLRNGQAHGTRILRLGETDHRALKAAVTAARYVIVNYELLQPHRDASSPGVQFYRTDLPGWNPFLAEFTFDVAILDEIHLIRGWDTNKAKQGHTKRDKVIQALSRIPQAWGLTGTPIFGFVKDLWAPLDALSAGAVTGPGRLWFDFTIRYSGAHQGEHGWVYTGRTVYADHELPDRLSWVKIQRPRSLILSQMPKKQRIVHRLDPDSKANAALQRAAGATQSGGSKKLTALLGQTGTIKRPNVIESVTNELLNGEKVVIFTLLTKSAEAMYRDLGRALQKKTVRTRMAALNARAWLVHGGKSTPQNRALVARAFREHQGAAAIVATIDALQVGISLKGATNVHFAELHWNPAAMLQAEDRPYEVGVSGLTVVYWIVRRSIDEHVEAVIMPKFLAQERVVAEEGASDVRGAFAGPEETEEEIWARITAAGLEEEDEEMFDD